MSFRRFLVLFPPAAIFAVVVAIQYLAIIWPYAPPDHSKVPFVLHVDGMPGIRMYLQTNDSVMTPTILRTGSWEKAETAQFIRTVKPGDTFVDAGANMGYYTIIGSRLVGDKGKVYAFEPEPKSFELLQKNVRLNGLTNVVLERKALSNRKGVIKLFIAPENKGDHRIYQPEGESRPSVEIEAVRLDEYLKAQGRGVDVLKSDTQGAEGLILEGTTGLLESQTDRPAIFMEFWPHALKEMGTDPAGLVKMLESYHYQFYDFHNNDNPKLGLTRVEPADLAAYPDDGQRQTDLMLVRGSREPSKDSFGRPERAATSDR